MKKILFFMVLVTTIFAQPRTYKTATNPNNACAAGFDIFVFWYSSFNDFDPMAVIYSGWAENFSADAEFGYTLQKFINGSWTTVADITLWNVGEPGIGWRWVYDGSVYMGKIAAPNGNGDYRSRGWVHAWYSDVYAYSDWKQCHVNDIIAPNSPPNFSSSWSSDHPTLTISGNEELDFKLYAIYKKVGSGTWNFLSNTTSGSFVDYSETRYTVGSGNKRIIWYKATAQDWSANESAATNSVKFVCNDWLNKNNNGENKDQIIYDFVLKQNYPNPFNPSTTIEYQIDIESFVELSVYNLLGQKVKNLVYENQTPGIHITKFDASNLPNGTYIYRLSAGQNVRSRKLILLK